MAKKEEVKAPVKKDFFRVFRGPSKGKRADGVKTYIRYYESATAAQQDKNKRLLPEVYHATQLG